MPVQRSYLLNHLVGASEQRRRNLDAERFRGVEVDHELEFRRLFDGQIGGFRALQDFVYIVRSHAEHVGQVRSIRHQAAEFGEFSKRKRSWKWRANSKVHDL